MDGLLAKRMAYFKKRRAISLSLTGCALMAAVGFVSFITRSISGPLRKQAADLQDVNVALNAEIAERRRVEEALRTKQAQIHAIQDASPLGIFFADPAGVCHYTNRMYELITGLAPEQTLGSDWRRAVHPEDFDRVMRDWTDAARNSHNFGSILRYQ